MNRLGMTVSKQENEPQTMKVSNPTSERVSKKEYEMNTKLQVAKGITGYWHFTYGDWLDMNHLKTLCGRGVSTHHRILTDDVTATCVTCLKATRAV